MTMPQRYIRLNSAFRSDLAWWHAFLETWNGISMLADAADAPPDTHLYTDASGGIGCGAWSGRFWFQYLWSESFAAHSIAVKELVPIVMACLVWGTAWRHQKVLAHCDNQVVVEVINWVMQRPRTHAAAVLVVFYNCPLRNRTEGTAYPGVAQYRGRYNLPG